MVAQSPETPPEGSAASVEPMSMGVLRTPGAGMLEAKTLHLANVLQSSLELSKLMEILSEEIRSVVGHEGLEYTNAEEGIEVKLGKRAGQPCTYRIVLLDKPLGQLSFYRHSRFSQAEAQTLDQLLCALIYPLRNALLYRRALQAALKDPVTGINNRAAFDATLEREVNLAHRHGTSLSVIMIDVDRFKEVNDAYGHLAGDAVLRALAERITRCVRRSDIVFRYGGEEFAVVLSSTGLHGARLLAGRICNAVKHAPIAYESHQIALTVSLGVASLEEGESATALVGKADRALYQAKQAGRNRVVCCPPGA